MHYRCSCNCTTVASNDLNPHTHRAGHLQRVCVHVYYYCLRGLDWIKVGRLARPAKKHIISSTTHTYSAWNPDMTDSWFSIPAVKTAWPQRATGIHTHTHICIHTLPWTFQHFVGMNSLPSIRVNRRQSGCTPPLRLQPKTIFWVMIKTEKSQNRNNWVQGHFQSFIQVQIHAVSLFLSTNMHSGEISPGPSDILCFCTTHTLNFLSLTPRDRGPGRAGLSQGLPSPHLQTCVL